jgi:uncharacterized damage-inducible protein DinB
MNRVLNSIIAAAFIGGGTIYAQTVSSFLNEPKQAFDRVKANILKAAEEMPDDNYSFQPTPDIRTFGQLVAHIADAQAHFCSAINGTQGQANASSRTSKAGLLAALKESNGECDKAYGSLSGSNADQTVGSGRMQRSRLGMLYLNVAHDNEEYGYMSVYLRLKGLIPPSSQVRPVPVR